MADITIHIDDVDVSTKTMKDGWSISHVEMGVKRASVILHELVYAMGDSLKLYENDVLKYEGVIEKEHIIDGQFTAYASDKLINTINTAARNVDHREYVETEVSDIVKDLLSYYHTGEYDVTNVDTTSTTIGFINLKDKSIFECLNILAQRAQFTMWLEPPNLLYFKAKDSVSSGFSAIYGSNIQTLDMIRDNFTKTRVIVRFTIFGTPAFVEVGTGTRTAIVVDDTIVTESDATDLGNAILQEMQDIQIRGSIDLVEPSSGFIAGQTIILHAPKYGFNQETIRIKQVIYTPFTTKLTVGLMTALVEDQMVNFEERINRMENRGITWQVTCESKMQMVPACGGPCEIVCEAACEISCESGACQAGACQSACQLTEQLSCVTTEQVCGTAGTCQVACEGGHRCDTSCQSECKEGCQSSCQSATCQADCQSASELACGTGCQTTCQDACQITGCEVDCQSTCETTAQCGACESGCQGTCDLKCQETCELGCEVGCELENLCCGTVGPD